MWRVRVGRCDLLLLDSNVEENAPEDRQLTSRLYGGDARVRIRQELLLGIGGFRALHAMGITPGVLHMNEGHSGFAVLEAIRRRMRDEGVGFDQAASRVAREVVFTTHTPVAAGHDRFDAGLIEEHLGPLCVGQPVPRCRSYSRNICGASQEGTWTPLVMWPIGTSSWVRPR